MCIFIEDSTINSLSTSVAATWMLEISTVSAEERLGQDFADIFDQSDLSK